MFGLETLLALGLGGFGYFKTRKFVRERLRFVDLVQGPAAPIVVGVATSALGLGLVVRIKEAFGTIEEDEIEDMAL